METYEVTTDLRFAQEVNAREELINPAVARVLKPGAEFFMVCDKHEWGVDPNGEKFPCYTIQILGEARRYSVLANLLEPRMRRITPAEG